MVISPHWRPQAHTESQAGRGSTRRRRDFQFLNGNIIASDAIFLFLAQFYALSKAGRTASGLCQCVGPKRKLSRPANTVKASL